jgi:hypothetical protein
MTTDFRRRGCCRGKDNGRTTRQEGAKQVSDETPNLRTLIAEERICRDHVRELRIEAAVLAAVHLTARRAYGPEAIRRTREEWQMAKAAVGQRLQHYIAHSDRLIAALRADAEFAEAEGLPDADAELRNMLAEAEHHRGETLKGEAQ